MVDEHDQVLSLLLFGLLSGHSVDKAGHIRRRSHCRVQMGDPCSHRKNLKMATTEHWDWGSEHQPS